jgi:molecular chaperone HtpG
VGDASEMVSLSLNYPRFFGDKLQLNTTLRAAVDSTVGVVGDMLQVSKLPFFPDYTGHGALHLASLLGIADKLIADQARDLFTAEDAAVLIFSTILHDLALHLSEAGFMSLLRSEARWAGSWSEFLAEARRWDDYKLVELFGADEVGTPRALVRNPLDHYDNLTESDRKLIGEFIRQNHAELAHHFAILGFPGSNGQLIQFGDFDPELKELAGNVARSHGYPLRECIQLLDKMQLSRLEQDDVHPVFLMGVLRVADFLELGTDRAPLIAFLYKEFKSPVSEKEWYPRYAKRCLVVSRTQEVADGYPVGTRYDVGCFWGGIWGASEVFSFRVDDQEGPIERHR